MSLMQGRLSFAFLETKNNNLGMSHTVILGEKTRE